MTAEDFVDGFTHNKDVCPLVKETYSTELVLMVIVLGSIDQTSFLWLLRRNLKFYYSLNRSLCTSLVMIDLATSDGSD